MTESTTVTTVSSSMEATITGGSLPKEATCYVKNLQPVKLIQQLLPAGVKIKELIGATQPPNNH